MAVVLSQYAGAGAQFFNNNGDPLNGGLIYTYAAGTTTPIATYTSSSGGTANANPIVLDSAGRTPAQIWLTAGNSYKFVLQTSLGTLIKTDDNIFASFELAKEIGIAVGLGAGSVATNIAVGDTALDSNTTGSNNTAVGYNALTSNTDGTQNVAVGSQALDANTGGDYNVAVGYDALSAATTANYNTGVGYRALNATTTGLSNTAVGGDALLSNQTGSSNVAVGYQAAKSLVNGSTNISIGFESLPSCVSGQANVAVGYRALRFNLSNFNTCVGFSAGSDLVTGSNNTVIGYGAAASSATVSNEITLGNSDVTLLRVPGVSLRVYQNWLNNGAQTVAALVAASNAGVGARAVVTDANATTFHSIVAGGGANVVPVFSDGTDWRIG